MLAVQVASALIGVVVGFIGATIFGIILRRISESQPGEAIKQLYRLISLFVGVGFGDYVIFNYILSSGAIVYYMLGATVTFLSIAVPVFFSSRK
jgi:uncharacterized membrane protein